MGRIFPAALFVVLVLPAARADEKWLRIRTGPFEILGNSEGPMRDRAVEAEQLRHVFGTLTGIKEPVSVWPIRVVVRKGTASGAIQLAGRDAFLSQAGTQQLGREWLAGCVRVLLDSNVSRLPAGMESGLISLLSTLQIKGTYLTIGAPPPVPERTRDWARLQMLATDPELASRFQIFIYNLTQGADLDTAYRNAYEKRAADMEKRVDAYLAAGSFGTAPISGRALSERDFTVREVPTDEGRAALADLNPSEDAYKTLPQPLSGEGLGWLSERDGHLSEAKPHYEDAVKAQSKNARAWAGIGTREGLTKASELNPLWFEPWKRLAETEKDPVRKAADVKKAATLARRDAGLWTAAALALQDADQYQDAAKAWTAAENAAVSDDERAKLRQERRDVEARRAEFEAAERKRIADEEAREIQKLKDAAMSDIRAAEAKANAAMKKDGAMPTKVEQWWDDSTGPKESAAGKLERVDCLRAGARWVILTDAGKRLTLRVADPGKVVVVGASEKTVGCGVQKPARRVKVEYFKDQLATVEFQ